VEQAIDAVAGFAKQLKGQAVVFAASEDYVSTRKTKPQLKEFIKHVVARRVTHPVLDLPGWSNKELRTLVGSAPVHVAFDPLEDPQADKSLAYLRLPGPSGYRSRYDAAALDRVVEFCEGSKAKHTFVAFRNIDRFENARYVMGKLGLAVES
jgi:hypothetical protein